MQENASTYRYSIFYFVSSIILFVFPSFRTIFKYIRFAPCISMIIYSFITIGIYFSIFFLLSYFKSFKLFKIAIISPFPTIALLLAIALVIIFIYPIADALKYQRRGSDQDDAVIITTQALLRGEAPYSMRTYFGNRPSPGPGELILYVPFVATGTYQAGTLVVLIILALVLRAACSNWIASNIFLALLSSSLSFWELIAAGSDLYFIGSIIMLAGLIVCHDLLGRLSGDILSGILCALISTSRVVFIFIPLVFGFELWKDPKYRGLIFASATLLLGIALHIIFYTVFPGEYTPLHIVRKAMRFSSYGMVVASLILLAFVGIVLYRYAQTLELNVLLIATLGTPLLCTSIAQLSTRHFNFANWEGASYLAPVALICASASGIFLSGRFNVKEIK